MRRRLRKAIVGAGLVLALSCLAPPAGAACGGCFCSPGSDDPNGTYACVELGGYTRWLKIAE